MKRIFAYAAMLAAVLISVPVQGQEFRATISGAVTDATGAVIAGVQITVTERNTSTKIATQTDASGHYTAPFLLPGDYDISAKMTGFKEYVRRGVKLGAGETPIIDIKMDVGDSVQSVEVTETIPLINNENASVGQTITAKEVEDLPSNGGTPMMLATFAMGVTMTTQPSQVLPFSSGGASAWSISGSPSQTNELLVDGVPNGTWDGRQAYSPPQDAVSEVRVKAFDSDASYGHTGGGTANQVLKSGSNAVRGTLSWRNQPGNLTSNDFFRNKSGLPLQITHFNQYTVTAGGPVVLPKVMDGRNKVFWFFAFEGVKDSQPAVAFLTVPTDAQRTGDFSQLLGVKAPTVLYDPYSATGTAVTRTAFPVNRIPSNLISPIAKKYLELIPAPNLTSFARDDGFNNFGSSSPSKDGYTNQLGRIDYNISPKHRTYFNVRHTDYFQTKNNYFENYSTGSTLSRNNWGATLDHVYMMSATNVLNLRLNFTRMFEDHSSPSVGVDPGSYGFPSYLAANSQYVQLPTMTFATNSGMTTLGFGGNANVLPSQSLQMFGSWVAIRGPHNLKFGGDVRQYRLNYRSYGNSAGTFAFSANNWVRASNSASSTVTMGQDLAEMLMGLPTGGSYDQNASAMYYAYYGALFVHDDWRVRRNLTINAGLRFDRDFPYHEKWGRVVNGFAFDTASPLAAAAQAAYAKSPNALLAAADFRVNGGLTFATPQSNAIYENTSHLLSPRIGFAWTPERFRTRLAIRSGFAMFVQPITIATLQVSGAYSTNPLSLQTGFSQSTPMVVTNNNYLSPAATLANPFPSGQIQQPAGSSAGLLTFAGQSVNFMNPAMKSPYSVRWNLSIQYQLASNTVVEMAYIGNHSVHLPVTYTQFNGIPRQFLSTLPVRDQPTITRLTASTPNPFQGLQTSTGTNSTVSTAQILARYPQFPVAVNAGSSGVVMNGNNVGSSYYNSLSLRLQRRLSKGFSLMGTFMYSRMIDMTTWLNDTDLQPERRISPFFRPMRTSIAGTYEIPVGRGRTVDLPNRWVNGVLGGWQTAATYQFQLGGPLTWLNGSTNNPGDYVYVGGDLNSQPRNVDTNAFDIGRFDRNNNNQFQYHVRTFSTTFPNIRADGTNEISASVLKRFNIGERRFVQIRGEAFNFVNHPVFGAPNTTATNSAFGTITSMANQSRKVQFVARVVF